MKLKLITPTLIICLCFLVFNIIANELRVHSADYCERYENEKGLSGEFRVDSVQMAGVDRMRLSLKDRTTNRKLIAYVDMNENWYTGNELRLSGIFRLLPKDEEFDYRIYMLKKGYCGELKQPEILEESTEGSGVIWHFDLRKELDSLRIGMISSLLTKLSEPSAGLVIAVVFGDTFLFSDELEEDFRQIGITHLVAVSGANFVLLIGLATFFLAKVPLRRRLILLGIIGTIYMYWVGFANLPAFRAYLFSMLYLLQLFTGRRISKINLFAIGLVLIASSAQGFYADLGLQLSLSAWAGVNLVLSPIMHKLQTIPEPFRSEFFASGLGTAVLLPITMLFFGQVNLLSVMFNALLVPIFGIANILFISLIPLSYSGLQFPSWIWKLSDNAINLLLKLISYFSNFEFVVMTGESLAYLILLLAPTYLIFMIYNYAQKQKSSISARNIA
ncbi:MAG: ComEC/Rec2 family competence protein [Candidatus Dojkabacteria bacterium]